MIENRYIAKIYCGETIWNMFKILHNNKFVCLSASPENDSNIKKYGYTKEEIIDKIVNDNNSVINISNKIKLGNQKIR